MTGTARPLLVDRGRTPRDCPRHENRFGVYGDVAGRLSRVCRRSPTGRAAAAAPQPAAPQPEPSTQTPLPPPQPEAPKADPAYGDKPDAGGGISTFNGVRGHDYFVKSYPDRTQKNVVTLAVGAGASVLIGGVGLYFHLDSRDSANQVSAHKFTGEPWSEDRQALYDDAHSSAVKAGVFYGIGGALLLGTAIAYMVTEPKQETMLIHPHSDPKPTALLAPTRGGALIGGTWSF